MRILYVAMKYDYGDPSRGYSFEHTNFYGTLVGMGHEVIYFDFLSEFDRLGRRDMNIQLLQMAEGERPDILFCVLYQDQLDIDVITRISTEMETVTFNWFCDDHWRFDKFSRHWAPAFNWVSTTDSRAIPKYQRIGYKNVIKTQWACNHFQYQRLGLPLHYDVTFVGQPHGTRRATIASLRKAGIDVRTWGHGWENGRLEQDDMIRVFNQSRINLNLSNASVATGRMGWRRMIKRQTLPPNQIKGRNFEIPGCGGFLLTDKADDLDTYYAEGREIGVFSTPTDLVEKIRYFLDHDQERGEIAAAGYQRTLAEHTYERRFTEIFATMGLRSGALGAMANCL